MIARKCKLLRVQLYVALIVTMTHSLSLDLTLTKYVGVTEETTHAGIPRGSQLVAEELQQQTLAGGEYRPRCGYALVERDVRQELRASRIAVTRAKVLSRAGKLRLVQVQPDHVIRFRLQRRKSIGKTFVKY